MENDDLIEEMIKDCYMTKEDFYDIGFSSNNREFCRWHGWVASSDSEGNVWRPNCGWIGHVPVYDDDD